MAKIILTSEDITTIKADAIVNAAKYSLLGGGGVDGAIHRAAGPELLKECATLHGCETGNAKITKAYNLPAKYIIHAVGPVYQNYKKETSEALLKRVYRRCFEIALQYNVKTIAFPCISTGIYGFPKQKAAQIAVEIFMEYEKYFEEIIVCTFENIDYEIYKAIITA